ncbi:MAG: hypothetical protein AB7V48_03595 [Sedimentibacter sp.]
MSIILYPARFYCPTDYIFNNSTRYNQRIDEEETGYLDITVYDNTNTPIKGALVTISNVSYTGQFFEIGDGQLLFEFYTDENGKIPITKLPVHNELARDLAITFISFLYMRMVL